MNKARRGLIVTFFTLIIFVLLIGLYNLESEETVSKLEQVSDSKFEISYTHDFKDIGQSTALLEVGEDISEGIYNLNLDFSNEETPIDNIYIRYEDNEIEIPADANSVKLKKGMVLCFELRENLEGEGTLEFDKIGDLSSSDKLLGGPYKVGKDIPEGNYFQTGKPDEDANENYYVAGEYVFFNEEVQFKDEEDDIAEALSASGLENPITKGVYASGIDIPLGKYKVTEDTIVYPCSTTKPGSNYIAYDREFEYENQVYFQTGEVDEYKTDKETKIIEEDSYDEDFVCVESGSLEMISLDEKQINIEDLIRVSSSETIDMTAGEMNDKKNISLDEIKKILHFSVEDGVEEEKVKIYPESIPAKEGTYSFDFSYTLNSGKTIRKTSTIIIEEVEKLKMNDQVSIPKGSVTEDLDSDDLVGLFEIQEKESGIDGEYDDFFLSNVEISPEVISKDDLDNQVVTATVTDVDGTKITKTGVIHVQGYTAFNALDQVDLYETSLETDVLEREDILELLEVTVNEILPEYSLDVIDMNDIIVSPERVEIDKVGETEVTLTYNYSDGTKYSKNTIINVLPGEAPIEMSKELGMTMQECEDLTSYSTNIIRDANIKLLENDKNITNVEFNVEEACNGEHKIKVYGEEEISGISGETTKDALLLGEIKVTIKTVFSVPNYITYEVDQNDTRKEIASKELLSNSIEPVKTKNITLEEFEFIPSVISLEQPESQVKVVYKEDGKVLQEEDINIKINRYSNTPPVIKYNDNVKDGVLTCKALTCPKTKKEIIDYLELSVEDKESGTADIEDENVQIDEENQIITVSIKDPVGTEGKEEFKYEIINDRYILYLFWMVVLGTLIAIIIGVLKMRRNR